MTIRPTRAWVEPVVALALACLLLGPALAPGFVLTYDMVWVPDLATRRDFLGVGSSLPRAVPSDAVVAVLDEVVPGALLQKLVLLGSLVGAGLGATRLVPGLPLAGRLTALTVYQWNAFVVERLVIGHWPVLVGYAVLPWVLVLGRRWRETGRLPRALPALVCLGCLSAGAGLVTAAALAAASLTREPRRWVAVAVIALVGNAPWLASGLLHAGSAVTDAASAALFALSDEGPLPGPLAALTLGGIWNADVVPATRDSPLALITLVAVVAAVVGGYRSWERRAGGDTVTRVALLAAGGAVVAVLTWAAPDAIGWVIERVPGAGVLRDGSRFLALLAPALASLAGCAVAGLSDRVGAESRRWVAACCAALPLVLLPDAALGASGALGAVDYPADYAEARAAIIEEVDGGRTGDVLVLPLSSYRQPGWNDDHKVLDPLGRYLTPDYVASDELYVVGGDDEGTVLPGEDPRAARARTALGEPTPERRAAALARLGIGLVVIDDGAPGAVPDLAAEVVWESEGDDAGLRVLAIDGAETRTVPSSWWAVMAAAWVAFSAMLATSVAGAAASARGRRRSPRRRREP